MAPEVSVSVDGKIQTTVITVSALEWLINSKLNPPYTMAQISEADQYAAVEMEKLIKKYGTLKTDPADDP